MLPLPPCSITAYRTGHQQGWTDAWTAAWNAAWFSAIQVGYQRGFRAALAARGAPPPESGSPCETAPCEPASRATTRPPVVLFDLFGTLVALDNHVTKIRPGAHHLHKLKVHCATA